MVRGALFALLFAAFWASSLSVRQDGAALSETAHYISRVTEILTCFAVAVTASHGIIAERKPLSYTVFALIAVYGISEIARFAIPQFAMTIEVIGAIANGLLVTCLAMMFAWTLTSFSANAVAVLVPGALAGGHVIFLAMGLLPGSWIPGVKVVLLIAASTEALLFKQGYESLRVRLSVGPSKVLGSFTELSNFPLWFGMVVFPLFYGFMAQICSSAGISSGLFDVATEVVGVSVLTLMALCSCLWREKFDAESVFSIILPVFTTALLFLPLFWNREVFVSGFIMKCGFLVYTALMWTTLCRMVSNDGSHVFYVFGVSLGLYHLTLMVGRLAAGCLAHITTLSFSTVALAALVAVWALSMAALAVMIANRSKKDSPLEVDYESALEHLSREYGLSERECAVLRDFARGRTVEYIAGNLEISQETVKTHLKRAYAKTSCHSRQDLLDKIDRYVQGEAR